MRPPSALRGHLGGATDHACARAPHGIDPCGARCTVYVPWERSRCNPPRALRPSLPAQGFSASRSPRSRRALRRVPFIPLAPLPPRASPLPIRPACSAPAAHFAAYSAASTPDVSRETSVLAPRLAHDSGSSSMPPLTVEASVGSRSAVTFPPPDVRQNRRFGSPSSDFAVTGHRRHGFGRQYPRSGFSAAENRELRLPKRRFCRTGGGGNGAAGATGRESALVQRRSMEEGDPSMGGGSGAMRQIEVRASVRVAAQLPKWMRVKSAFE